MFTLLFTDTIQYSPPMSYLPIWLDHWVELENLISLIHERIFQTNFEIYQLIHWKDEEWIFLEWTNYFFHISANLHLLFAQSYWMT